MKPHEETWEAETFGGDILWLRRGPDGDPLGEQSAKVAWFVEDKESAPSADQASPADRAKLAAQAPAMARLLIECKESLVFFDQTTRADDLGESIAAILRDAGVLP